MAKDKKINVSLIPERDGNGDLSEPYRLLNDLVAKHHTHLAEAKIALLFRYSVKPDKDGHLTLGCCKKVSDADKELHAFDFAITLNASAWEDFTVAQRTALMDHELSHATVSIDDNDDERRDERGRIVYRLRAHDVEEFRDVIERNGLYKADLQYFAESVARARAERENEPLFQHPEPKFKIAASE